nr:MAG TPA: hypothetical protein [Caudoviricetes sp.]
MLIQMDNLILNCFHLIKNRLAQKYYFVLTEKG